MSVRTPDVQRACTYVSNAALLRVCDVTGAVHRSAPSTLRTGRRLMTAAMSSNDPQSRTSVSEHGARVNSSERTPPISTAADYLPTTYHRLVARRSGKSFREVAVVQEAPLPQPGPGEVLIRVHYAGINGGCETFRARAEYAFAGNFNKENFPLGAEGAGVVVAVGPDVSNIKVGQAVACNGGSAFAEFTIAKAQMCTPVDAATPEAVAVTLSALTACAALEGTAKIRAGKVVVVTAAAGGTGHFAVQLALLAGCQVVAVCGGDNKAQALKQLGAHHVINYKTQDLSQELSKLCPAGVDVVYEGVGGDVQRTLLSHLSPIGQLLQVGYISEYPHVAGEASSSTSQQQEQKQQRQYETARTASTSDSGMPPISDLFWGGQNIQRGQQQIIGQIWPRDPIAVARCRRRVFDLYKKGQLTAWVDQSHGLRGVAAIPDAIDYMLQGRHVGKVVIQIQ